MNPGTLSANGHDVSAVRDALMASLTIWNEESSADITLHYAGDVTWTSAQPGSVLVRFQNTWVCPGDNGWYGKAFPMSCRTTGSIVHIMLQECDGTPRPWTTDAVTSGDGISFQAVLAHEIGHAAFGFPDIATPPGDTVMWYTSGPNFNSSRHLYTVDINTARENVGLTNRWARVATSSSGTSFGTATSLGFYASHGVALAGVQITG